MSKQRYSVSRTETDAQGNAGMVAQWGSFDTLEDAQRLAEVNGSAYHPHARFHWKQFSPTTWGLMAGQRFTFIDVHLIPTTRA